MRTTSVLILSDDREFARLLTACWQVERQLPELSVVTSESASRLIDDLVATYLSGLACASSMPPTDSAWGADPSLKA